MAEDNCVLSSLVSNTASWSLANDDALLGALQDISQNLLSRTGQVLDKMDKLALRAESVQIKLDTANNNFLGLSNTKFIEARVYDDNEETGKTEDVPDNKNQLSEEDIILEAFKQGLNFVNSGFEKIPIENSDSESDTEEEKHFYVLQPINQYHLRPLPAVIGTSEWFDDDKIGLAEDNRAVEEEVQSESESEDENVVRDEDRNEESDFSSDSETKDKTEEAKQVSPPLTSKVDHFDSESEFSEDEDDELFKPKQKPTEDIQKELKTPTVSRDEEVKRQKSANSDLSEDELQQKVVSLSFADELSSKLGSSKTTKIPLSDGEVDEQNELIKEREEYIEPKPKLIQKSALFYSSESDDDLFSGKASLPKKAVKVKSNKPKTESSKKEGPNFKHDVLSRQDDNREKAPPLPPQAIIPPPKSNILDDSTDNESGNEELDIFADLKVTKPVKADEENKKKPKGLFSFSDDSDSEDDIFADIGGKLANNSNKKDQQTKKSHGSEKFVSNFVEEDRPVNDNEDDLFADVGVKSQAIKSIEDKNEDTTEPIVIDSIDKEVSDPSNDESAVNETIPQDAITHPKKAPVGGVSMFGKGFNLGSLLKKKVSPGTGEDAVDAEEDAPAMKESNVNQENKSIEERPAPSDSSVLPINIDDMANVEAKALDTVTKSRPKINKGRRPPTRAGRKKVEDISIFTDLTEPTSKADITANDLEPTSVNKREGAKPVGGVSLFGGFNPTDVINRKSKEKGVLGSVNSAPEDFSVSPISISLAPTLTSEDKSEDEDSSLFDEPPPMDIKPTKDNSSKDIFGDSDSDDDLFSDLISKTEQKPNVSVMTKNNLFGFDEEVEEDDIFADIMKKK